MGCWLWKSEHLMQRSNRSFDADTRRNTTSCRSTPTLGRVSMSGKSLQLRPLAIAALALSFNCQPDPTYSRVREMGREVLAVKFTPELSKADAEKVIGFYFQTKISGCGFPSGVKDEGEFWSSVPKIGLVGTPHEHPVLLHKRTGRITWAAGPTYESIPALVLSTRRPFRDAFQWQ